ncbi:MAG: DnaB-like helicase C-terminal domain-containing protein [Acidimicrobiales bacterium]
MTLVNAHDRALQLLQRLSDRGPTTPVSTGLGPLDDVLGGGFRPGLAICGGIPGVGKTAFGLQLTLRAARDDTPAVYLSAEQRPDELLARLLAAEVRRPVSALLDGDPGVIAAAFEAVDRMPLHLVYVEGDPPSPGGSVKALAKVIDEVSQLQGSAPFACVDYLQKLSAGGPNGKDDIRVAIGKVSAALSALVRESGISLLAISSLNRASYKERPSLESFKETGNIEFDADLAMILKRPEPVKDGAEDTTPALSSWHLSPVELWIVKNRIGPVPAEPIALLFDGALGSFRAPEGESR